MHKKQSFLGLLYLNLLLCYFILFPFFIDGLDSDFGALWSQLAADFQPKVVRYNDTVGGALTRPRPPVHCIPAPGGKLTINDTV